MDGGNLFDVPARNLLTPSPQISEGDSIQSSNGSNYIQKHRFDDRSQTSISIALRSYSSKLTRQLGRNNSSFDGSKNSTFQWNEMHKILKTIEGSSFVASYGTATLIEPSSLYVAVGTLKGYVICFSYHQEAEYSLHPTRHNDIDASQSQHESVTATAAVAITSLCFSSDVTSLVAGYSDGSINLWQLSLSSSGIVIPLYTIQGIAKHDRLKKNVDGHIVGTPITYVSFIGSLRYKLVSSDRSGYIFYHHGFKKFMRKYFVTHKIIGNSGDNKDKDREQSHDVLACELLPLGNTPQITDQWGVLAVLTDHLLVVVTILSLNDSNQIRLVNHFKTGIPKIINDTPIVTGCLSWFPCLDSDNGSGVTTTTTRLAYSWNNIITVLELQNASSFLDEYMKELIDRDKTIGTLAMKRTCRWKNSTGWCFRSLQWISPTLLSLFLNGKDGDDELKFETLSYIGGNRLLKVGNPDPMDLKIFLNKELNSFTGSIKVIKGRIMLLTESYHNNQKHLFVGMQLQWSDIIEISLARGDYSKALNLIHKLFFSTDVLNIVSTDLPLELKPRQKILETIVLRVITSSIKLFQTPMAIEDTDLIEENLSMVFDLISKLSTENSSLSPQLLAIMEEIFEVMDDNKRTFFAVLEEYILLKKISSLLALVLKEMVRYYITKEKGELLTEIICILDIKSLDIDNTIQLCKLYDLRDCLIYIWNYVLHDYATPLMDFIGDIIQSMSDSEKGDYLLDDDKQLHKVFSYISFILTGRQYPTDRYVQPADETFARKSIEEILFAVNILESGNAKPIKPTIFPYLFLLLKFDSFEMLSSLNEFFEDYTLNDKELNRQYIIEALLDIYEVNRSSFLEFDFCSLAIFIARNYSKYPQFIRLPDSILDKVIDDLCNYDDNWGTKISINDCELALQCLLQRYLPDNTTYLLVKLKEAKFYSILMNIYKAEEKYSQVAATWFEKNRRVLPEKGHKTLQGDNDESDYYDSMKVVLEMCLENSSITERMGVNEVIRRNFKFLVELDFKALLSLLNAHEPNLHSEILKIPSGDIDTLVFQYLETLFQDYDKHKRSLDIPSLLELGLKYIELLCMFSPKSVYPYVKEHMNIFDEKKEELLDVLQNGGAIESKSLLLVYQKHYFEALTNLISYACEVVVSDISNFENVIRLAMDICHSAEGDPSQKSETDDSKLNLNEKLWLQLVESLVRLSNNYGADEKEHKLLNMSIHNCFREISEDSSNIKENVSFMRIFNNLLLEASTQNETTLSNVRSILRDVFLTYSFEKDSMGLMQNMLLQKIYKLLGIVKMNALQGHQITSKNCGVCNKVLWGSKIPIEHYEAWETLEILRIDSQTTVHLEGASTSHPMVILGRGSPDRIDGLEDINAKDYEFLKLLYFACGHGYHYQCLTKLNSVGSCLLPH